MARSTSTTSVGLQAVSFATVEQTKRTLRPVYQEGSGGEGRDEVR